MALGMLLVYSSVIVCFHKCVHTELQANTQNFIIYSTNLHSFSLFATNDAASYT